MYLYTPGTVTANLILSPTLNFVAGPRSSRRRVVR